MPRLTALKVAEKNKVAPEEKRTVVITGSSSGIGFAASAALARTGWRVICAVRSVDKMDKLISGLKLPEGSGSLESMELDLSSFDSVKEFATALLKREDVQSIHALVLNAGLGMQWAQTKDGYEQGFQTCHLSHHLLVRLLEARLTSSAPSRVVIVASHAHKSGSPSYDWPREGHKGFKSDSVKGFSVPLQYGQSKLANMHFALILAKHLQGKGVAVLTQHPGVINSNLWPRWMIGRSLYMLNTEQGAATLVYQITDPGFTAASFPGATYWAPSRMGLPHQESPTRTARDEAIAQRLWDETEKITAPWRA